MASLVGKLRKRWSRGFTMQWKGYEQVVDDESVAMMSSGDVDVEPFLSSRNTLGNGSRDSKSQMANRKNGWCLRKSAVESHEYASCGTAVEEIEW